MIYIKSSEVLKILRVSRPTLTKYVKEGYIKVNIMKNGRYDYDSNSVFEFLNSDIKRKTYIYARVSTNKQKKDLENQVELLKKFCLENSIQLNGVYKDVASGITFEKRKEFFKLLDEIIDKKVEKVIIISNDILFDSHFELIEYILNKNGCEIISMDM